MGSTTFNQDVLISSIAKDIRYSLRSMPQILNVITFAFRLLGTSFERRAYILVNKQYCSWFIYLNPNLNCYFAILFDYSKSDLLKDIPTLDATAGSVGSPFKRTGGNNMPVVSKVSTNNFQQKLINCNTFPSMFFFNYYSIFNWQHLFFLIIIFMFNI